MNKSLEFIKKNLNYSITENGALGYETTGNALLDMNFKVSSYRNREEGEIIKDFIKAYYEDKKMAVIWLFYIRDILEGLGERKIFRACMRYLADSNPDIAEAVLELIPQYGRFDDLLVLLDTRLKGRTIAYIKSCLTEDLKAMEENKPVSLLAKWLPSINTLSEKTRKYAKALIKGLGISEKEYRKTLSRLRAYGNVLEVKLSANRWDEVKYETVPAKANMKYDDAFLRHDGDRRKDYILEALEKDGKLNINGLMPYEIVHRYSKKGWYFGGKEDILAEALWKKMTEAGFSNKWGFEDCIVVADTSGSMMSNVSGETTVTAMDVCFSLALYFAKQLKGAFNDKVITFSERPRFIDLSKGDKLKEKLEIMMAHSEVANTNIEAVFNLLLGLAKSQNVPAEDLPKQVLIISDMEFDFATDRRYDEKLFETIDSKFKAAGYNMPRLIFWNVCGRTDTIPMVDNEEGLCLLSGFSEKAMKVATSKDAEGNTIKNPYEALLQVLNSDRFKPVASALSRVLAA